MNTIQALEIQKRMRKLKREKSNASPLKEKKEEPIDIGYGQITGIGFDKNGNKVIKLKTNSGKSFSIQTNGNLPSVERASNISDLDKSKAEKEILDYIKKYGTKNQKDILPKNMREEDESINTERELNELEEIFQSIRLDEKPALNKSKNKENTMERIQD